MDKSQFPEPHSSVAGRNNPDTSFSVIRRIAAMWRPSGANEPDVSTLSRFAARLIDYGTGLAYSVDELIAYLGGAARFVKSNDSGILEVSGIAPRKVLAAQIATDVPANGELVTLPDHSNCTCVGDGVSAVKDLPWQGTLFVTVTPAYVAANLVGNTIYIPANSGDVVMRVLGDAYAAGLRNVMFPGWGSYQPRYDHGTVRYSFSIATLQSGNIAFGKTMIYSGLFHDGAYFAQVDDHVLGVGRNVISTTNRGWNDA